YSRTVQPKYLARGTIWVQSLDYSQRNSGPIQSGDLLPSTGFVNLLHSFVVMDEVVRRTRLYLAPWHAADSTLFATLTISDRLSPGDYKLIVDPTGKQFTLQTLSGFVVQRGQLGDSIGAALGLQW